MRFVGVSCFFFLVVAVDLLFGYVVSDIVIVIVKCAAFNWVFYCEINKFCGVTWKSWLIYADAAK